MRTVLITGAARGLGFASAATLYRRGWRVLAAMRSVEAGLAALRAETGAAADDPRLLGVRLDLCDPESVAAAAAEILARAGAPDAIVHNAGISAAGTVEETPPELWQRMFATHVFGPAQLTAALLPGLRAAGRGRIVLISSAGGVRGMPMISAYSAAKGALERFGESLAGEVAPYGIGVTVLVVGVFDTEIITDDGTFAFRDFDGPYGALHATVDRRGRAAMRIARPPAVFAARLATALDDTAPYARHAVGADAAALVASNRALPAAAMHQVVRLAMGLPRYRALRAGGIRLGLATRALLRAAELLPAPVTRRITLPLLRIHPTQLPTEAAR
ncbi:SDR family NAD(P)-dependent oxidoreductase [Nocardia sp. NPDC057227]|uniref:SDR family NAD(P)-dependent oxidoreductase n=1 Tax=Nocardia sp. NPDC057227 TaxID=3346056 RepID=UPI00363E6C37